MNKDLLRVGVVFGIGFAVTSLAPSKSPYLAGVRMKDSKYTFKMLKPKESDDLVFEDDALRIVFKLERHRLEFSLLNKTDSPMKLDWNQMSYVDPESGSHKVMHFGVRYIERDKALAPTVIPPSAKVDDEILPTDLVHYEQYGWNKGWNKKPLFPKPEKKEARALIGKTFSAFMPVEINSTTKNYNFVFQITDIVTEK
jgi:hypothetical protein